MDLAKSRADNFRLILANSAARDVLWVHAQSQIRAAADAIHELGAELKDPERGMVDFRTLRDGRVVYLCWLMEEPRVMYWHELDAGYRGRQRLED